MCKVASNCTISKLSPAQKFPTFSTGARGYPLCRHMKNRLPHHESVSKTSLTLPLRLSLRRLYVFRFRGKKFIIRYNLTQTFLRFSDMYFRCVFIYCGTRLDHMCRRMITYPVPFCLGSFQDKLTFRTAAVKGKMGRLIVPSPQTKRSPLYCVWLVHPTLTAYIQGQAHYQM